MIETILAYGQKLGSLIDTSIPFFSLITSIAAVVISVITYKSQKTHNKNSVRPILNIDFGDYENKLEVQVVNNGVGPAIISDINCTYECAGEKDCQKSLVELIPACGTMKLDGRVVRTRMTLLSDFVEDITGMVIPPNGKIVLLQLLEPSAIQLCVFRNFMQNCNIEILYSDIYNSKPWKCQRSLKFFGRTLPSDGYSIQYF